MYVLKITNYFLLVFPKVIIFHEKVKHCQPHADQG
jgi:hypothetical protein